MNLQEDRPPPGKEEGRWRGTNDPKSNQRDCFNDEEILASASGGVKSSSTGITGPAARSSGAKLRGDDVLTSEKITDYAHPSKKTPTTPQRKTPTTPLRKTPPDYLPRSLWVVVGKVELHKLLIEHSQNEWATLVREGALLCLLDYLVRNHHREGARVSSALARDYVSEHNHPKRDKLTIRKPLALLEEIGLVEKVRGHIFGPHVKDSAMYVIPIEHFQRKKRREVWLNQKQVAKMANAAARHEKRLNRRWYWREQLVKDLKRVSLSRKGREVALTLFRDREKEIAARSALRFLDGDEAVIAVADPSSTIRTNLSSCPKQMKLHFLFDGKAVANCDIAHAHHCFLPKLLMDRISHLAGDTADMETELLDLREFLSEGDYYQKWCIDPSSATDRKEKKKLLTILLNMSNSRALANGLYQRMRSRFPYTFGILEDIKRANHKTISVQLRNYTARVVNQALLEIQESGIPAIPDTDAIWCPVQFKEVACEAIGRAMHSLTGVRSMVGEIRFEPRGEQGMDCGLAKTGARGSQRSDFSEREAHRAQARPDGGLGRGAG